MKTSRLLKLAMLSLLSLVVLSAAWTADDPPEVAWIAKNAVKLQTPEAGHGFTDMQPLKKIVGTARIVSLGEATHGTREFFQLKHRMLEFLTTEMGFTIFSIEANMPEAYRLNDYVLTGNGDPAKLLRGMYFWTWDTQEVLDMILWMREMNKSGKAHVEFTGFDMQTPDVALGIVNDFAAKTAGPDLLGALRQASDLAKTSRQAGGPSFGVATGSFPVAQAAGKRVRFSGYIKTENITRGFAGLWWRVDGDSGVLAFDNMQDRGATGTTDWKRYELELPVAAEVKNINFGLLHTGNGTAWFDSLSIELDGKPYLDQSAFDLDFESTTAKGFYTGGAGYRVALDSDVAHSGKQSLVMKWLDDAPSSAPKAADPKVAAASWKEVVGLLEAGRASYRDKKVADHEVEWAIQNARVVLQCMQMRANEISRDHSMAENVKWIADQNPLAKIVLWLTTGTSPRTPSEGMNRWGPRSARCSATRWWSSGSPLTKDRSRPSTKVRDCGTSPFRRRRPAAWMRRWLPAEFRSWRSTCGRFRREARWQSGGVRRARRVASARCSPRPVRKTTSRI